ncbi:YIF1 [Lotmaria passim]
MSFTPQSPSINFASPSSAPGSAFLDRSDPNAMMLQMGLSYGQSILQQQLQQGEAGLTYYMPFIRVIRNYFAVDNTYVKRKLVILIVPFLTRFVRKPSAGGEGEFGGGGGGASGENSEQVFGGPPGTPAATIPSGSPATRFGPSPASDGGPQAPTLPIHDVFACDLYIPLMSVITYIVLSAFIDGANSLQREITADSLMSTAWVIAFWFLLELLVMKGLAYAFRVVTSAPFLEVASLCGYKYVLLCIGVLIAQALPPSRLGSGLVMLYGLLANGFFTLRVISLRLMREDGRVPPRSRAYAYACAILQMPAFVWMFVRPLYTSE